jgi:hypothetical protein
METIVKTETIVETKTSRKASANGFGWLGLGFFAAAGEGLGTVCACGRERARWWLEHEAAPVAPVDGGWAAVAER